MAYNIFIDKNLNDAQLATCFAKILSEKEEHFFILHGYLLDYIDEHGKCSIDYREQPNDPRYLCEVNKLTGDFIQKIEIDIAINDRMPTELEFARSFCKLAQVNCLFGSEFINPYHWIYVDKEGNDKPVFVDRIRLDDHNEFVINRDAPLDYSE
jgi:hypothetical protein